MDESTADVSTPDSQREALEIVKKDFERISDDERVHYRNRQVARDAAVWTQAMIEALPKG